MNKPLLSILFLGGLLLSVKLKQSTMPRGIRNKNPGNIRYSSGNNWRGQVGTDGDFAIFSHEKWGVRALAKLLLNYQSKYGLNTVAELISRYAPSSENDTKSYVDSVSSALNVDSGEYINVRAKISDLIKAIIHHENGTQPYSDSLISAGVELAKNG